MKKLWRCPCGGRIVSDDEALVIKHEAPVCEAFERGMLAAGMKPNRGEWIEHASVLTGEIIEKGKA